MNYDDGLPQSGFVTRDWLKRYFKISNSSLHQWQAEGLLPKGILIGKRARRIPVADVRALVARLTAEAEGGER